MKTIITIGVCARNCENTLGNTLNSIINQDFPHEKMEMIFVDDGSEDHTLQIMDNYIQKIDIKTKVFHTKWQGLGPARNLVVKNADGEYIVWVDADEILSASYIRKQIEFMEKNPDVGITAGIVRIVQGNLILNLELIPAIINHFNYGKQRNFLWKTEKLPGTGGSTFRAKALRQVNAFDEQLTGVGEDQDVAEKIKRAGWLIRLNNADLYELHGGMSTLNDLWKKYLWYGHGGEKIYRQNRELFSFIRMSPVASIFTGFFYSLIAYKLLHQKKVFLLPIHYGIKMTAWMLGFISGQIRASYGPAENNLGKSTREGQVGLKGKNVNMNL
jgi:glycosyltransferase involved in cell wall biosynthesis